jgi:hypothetical protein
VEVTEVEETEKAEDTDLTQRRRDAEKRHLICFLEACALVFGKRLTYAALTSKELPQTS